MFLRATGPITSLTSRRGRPHRSRARWPADTDRLRVPGATIADIRHSASDLHKAAIATLTNPGPEAGSFRSRPSGDVAGFVAISPQLHLPRTLSKKASRCREAFYWWAVQGSNLRPLPCEGSALPLS